MPDIPKDKASFDKLDTRDKDKVKKDLLRRNSETISSILDPEEARIKFFSIGLIRQTQCEEYGLKLDRKIRISVMFDMLRDIQRNLYNEKTPWWEKLDTILKQMDQNELYSLMNPWENNTDGKGNVHMTSGTTSFRQSLPSPRRGDGGPPYSPDTSLAHAADIAQMLADLCSPSDQGSLWRKLAHNLGLTEQDEHNLKQYEAPEIYVRLVDTYVERCGDRATVGGLISALIQLGDVGMSVAQQMEENEAIQLLGRNGCETDFASGLLPGSDSTPLTTPKSSGKYVPDPYDCQTPNTQIEYILSSGTAAEVRRSGITVSTEDNAKQPVTQSPVTENIQEDRKVSDTFSFSTQHADWNQAKQCIVNDLQMDCNETPETSLAPSQNMGGIDEAIINALSTEHLAPCRSTSSNTVPKILRTEESTDYASTHRDYSTERHPLPGPSDQQSAPVIINIHSATNVVVGKNTQKTQTEPAFEQFDAGCTSSEHLESHQERIAPQSPEDTSEEPLPWDLGAHQTELKQMIYDQENDDGVSMEENPQETVTIPVTETLQSPSSTTSIPSLQNEVDAHATTPAVEQDLQTHLPSNVHEDGDNPEETTSATKSNYGNMKDTKGFIPRLKSLAVEFWDCWSLLE